MKGCECEHESHFGTDNDVDGGGPSTGHPYGSCHEGPIVEVKTIYGTYRICEACRVNHPIPDTLLDKDGKGAESGAKKVLKLSGVMKEIRLDKDGQAIVEDSDA